MPDGKFLKKSDFLNRTTLYKIILLTALWIVLSERLSVSIVILGIVISTGCVFICARMLPQSKTKNVNFFWLIIYIFYLAGQVYLAGFRAVKLIFAGADIHVVKLKTKITNSFLRTILANSITLTPCTVLLEIEGDTLTVLYLKDRNKEDDTEFIKDRIERMLIKAERPREK